MQINSSNTIAYNTKVATTVFSVFICYFERGRGADFSIRKAYTFKYNVV